MKVETEVGFTWKTVINCTICKQREGETVRVWQASDQQDNNPPRLGGTKPKMQQLATVLWGTLTLTLINKQVRMSGKSLQCFHLEIREKLEVLSSHSGDEPWFWHVCRRTEEWRPGDYQRRRRRKKKHGLHCYKPRVFDGTTVLSLYIIYTVHELTAICCWADQHPAGLPFSDMLYWIYILKDSKWANKHPARTA